MNPTVIDMVLAALKAGGYDGLFNVYGECACEVDDLSPCSSMGEECQAGFKVPCSPDCDHGYAPTHGDWHIQEKKAPACLAAEKAWREREAARLRYVAPLADGATNGKEKQP